MNFNAINFPRANDSNEMKWAGAMGRDRSKVSFTINPRDILLITPFVDYVMHVSPIVRL